MPPTKTTTKNQSRPFREGFWASAGGRGKGLNPYLGRDDTKYDEWRAGWEAHYYKDLTTADVKPLPPRR
jgi:hypothetical protein